MVEIACDESGSEGENLLGGETDVLAHGSVRLDAEAAADCVRELRDRIRSPAQEYKANHLLRTKHRGTLVWLLGPSGPIHHRAQVHLTDKTFFVVGKIVDLVLDEIPYTDSIGHVQGPRARALTTALHREGPRVLGPDQWTAFLRAFVGLLRLSNRRGAATSPESFSRLAGRLAGTAAPGQVQDVLNRIRDAPEIGFRADPKLIPPLDPLMPAIIATIRHWSDGGTPVAVVHDEQPSLKAERIAQLEEILAASPGTHLRELRFADSRDDPRVQVADFLAGVARRIASDELNGHGDGELTALLRSYVDTESTWADDDRARPGVHARESLPLAAGRETLADMDR